MCGGVICAEFLDEFAFYISPIPVQSIQLHNTLLFIHSLLIISCILFLPGLSTSDPTTKQSRFVFCWLAPIFSNSTYIWLVPKKKEDSTTISNTFKFKCLKILQVPNYYIITTPTSSSSSTQSRPAHTHNQPSAEDISRLDSRPLSPSPRGKLPHPSTIVLLDTFLIA